jgi:hypothetical protein
MVQLVLTFKPPGDLIDSFESDCDLVPSGEGLAHRGREILGDGVAFRLQSSSTLARAHLCSADIPSARSCSQIRCDGADARRSGDLSFFEPQ